MKKILIAILALLLTSSVCYAVTTTLLPQDGPKAQQDAMYELNVFVEGATWILWVERGGMYEINVNEAEHQIGDILGTPATIRFGSTELAPETDVPELIYLLMLTPLHNGMGHYLMYQYFMHNVVDLSIGGDDNYYFGPFGDRIDLSPAQVNDLIPLVGVTSGQDGVIEGQINGQFLLPIHDENLPLPGVYTSSGKCRIVIPQDAPPIIE
jgi:hypothetical protein